MAVIKGQSYLLMPFKTCDLQIQSEKAKNKLQPKPNFKSSPRSLRKVQSKTSSTL